MEANEKIFADGLIVKRKDSAPEWVKANLSVKVEEFKKFLDTHNKNGWVNIDVLQSKGGKLYAEKNTWEPKASNEVQTATHSTPKENDSSDLPF
jgi:hypothetical protein